MATNIKKAKSAAKKVNKPAPAKKASAKKAAPSKKAAVKKSAASQKSKKPAPVKKATVASQKTKKSAHTIQKTSPAQKAAKAGVKKAVSKNLATPKKTAAKKPVTAVPKKASGNEKAAIKKPITAKNTAAAKAVPPRVNTAPKITDHQIELKKALAKVKAKKKEEAKKETRPFIIPKTHTEKSRKYEPEFTKSVLDQTAPENTGPTLRYSDSELQEFRELISRKLETAKKELGYLQGLITRKDQLGGDESDNRYMTMEDGSLSMEREQLSQMASRQITFIDHLEKAMMRIENKTYGICRVTGKLIDKARLRAVPHATLSIEAKMGIAK